MDWDNISGGVNLTLIQAIPYIHNKYWNMDNPISIFVWPSHKKVQVFGRGRGK